MGGEGECSDVSLRSERMCGILFELRTRKGGGGGGSGADENVRRKDYNEKEDEEENGWLNRRGPDASGELVLNRCGENGVGPSREVEGNDDCRQEMRFVASVLQLRGEDPIADTSLPFTRSAVPLLSSSTSSSSRNNLCSFPSRDHQQQHVLLFNGEIYSGLEDWMLDTSENDALALLRALADATTTDVPTLMARLRGPWAFVYYDPRGDCLWYGRDAIGRRSLLMHLHSPRTSSSEDCTATAAAAAAAAADDNDGAAALHFRRRNSDAQHDFQLASVADTNKDGGTAPNGWQEVSPGLHRFIFATRAHEHLDWKDDDDDTSNGGGGGGGRLLTRIRQQKRVHVPHDMGVGPEARCRAADGSTAPVDPPDYVHLSPRDFMPLSVYVSSALDALDAAVATRVRTLRANLVDANGEAASAPFAVGFSGGVDSCILAALLHRHLDPEVAIDLPNVSFAGEEAPDRVNARYGLAELQRTMPGRSFRLICIDATQEDADAVQPRIRELLAPANTYMDMNIGTALWFVARAQGRIDDDDDGSGHDCIEGNAGSRGVLAASSMSTEEKKMYRSPAKVLFLGTGIDEQCAGYGRHFSRFRDAGWQGLQEELSLDVERLWRRNLGRDDRLVADHGREARHPFLDEGFMDELLSMPLHIITDLRMARGIGDKRIVREMAIRLGLTEAATRVKRAIQFGTRLAKISNRRDFGSNRRANASHAGSVVVPYS